MYTANIRRQNNKTICIRICIDRATTKHMIRESKLFKKPKKKRKNEMSLAFIC